MSKKDKNDLKEILEKTSEENIIPLEKKNLELNCSIEADFIQLERSNFFGNQTQIVFRSSVGGNPSLPVSDNILRFLNEKFGAIHGSLGSPFKVTLSLKFEEV